MAREKMATGTDVTVDIENATPENVHAHTELMNANIAELIMRLDDATAAFSRDLDEMRTKTTTETLVGWFSSAKADSMREASVDDKLQDLISKSDMITRLLQNQLQVLNEQNDKVDGNLQSTLVDPKDNGCRA